LSRTLRLTLSSSDPLYSTTWRDSGVFVAVRFPTSTKHAFVPGAIVPGPTFGAWPFAPLIRLTFKVCRWLELDVLATLVAVKKAQWEIAELQRFSTGATPLSQ
jgi:hypothetical protein